MKWALLNWAPQIIKWALRKIDSAHKPIRSNIQQIFERNEEKEQEFLIFALQAHARIRRQLYKEQERTNTTRLGRAPQTHIYGETWTVQMRPKLFCRSNPTAEHALPVRSSTCPRDATAGSYEACSLLSFGREIRRYLVDLTLVQLFKHKNKSLWENSIRAHHFDQVPLLLPSLR